MLAGWHADLPARVFNRSGDACVDACMSMPFTRGSGTPSAFASAYADRLSGAALTQSGMLAFSGIFSVAVRVTQCCVGSPPAQQRERLRAEKNDEASMRTKRQGCFARVAGGALALLFVGLGAGCGGGSGGGSSEPPAPPVTTISLTPSTIATGESSVLTWSSTGASQCSASGAWTGAVATSGSQKVTQVSAGSYSYTVTCSGAGGSTANSATLTVNVPTPVVSIAVSPSSISTDHNATLTWSASNASSCAASGAWSGPQTVTGSITVEQPTPGSYPYTLSCSNGSQSASNSAALTVVIPQQLLASRPAPGPAPFPRRARNRQAWQAPGATTMHCSAPAPPVTGAPRSRSKAWWPLSVFLRIRRRRVLDNPQR